MAAGHPNIGHVVGSSCLRAPSVRCLLPAAIRSDRMQCHSDDDAPRWPLKDVSRHRPTVLSNMKALSAIAMLRRATFVYVFTHSNLRRRIAHNQSYDEWTGGCLNQKTSCWALRIYRRNRKCRTSEQRTKWPVFGGFDRSECASCTQLVEIHFCHFD